MSKVTRTYFVLLLLSTGAACVAGEDDALDDSAEQAVEEVCSAGNRIACDARIKFSNVRAQCRPVTTPNSGSLSVIFSGGLDCSVSATMQVKGVQVGNLSWQLSAFAGTRGAKFSYTGSFNGQQLVAKIEVVGANANIARNGRPNIAAHFCRGSNNVWTSYPLSFRATLLGTTTQTGAAIESLDLYADAMRACP